jgi:CRP-like cAMP-binding protein
MAAQHDHLYTTSRQLSEVMKTNRGDDARTRAAAAVSSLQTMIDRLNAAGDLTADDKSELAAMPLRVETLAGGQFILRQGDRASYCCLLLMGVLVGHRVAGSRNQILSFHVPGDLSGLQTLHDPIMDHDLSSSGRSAVGVVPHRFLHRVLANSRRLSYAVWRQTLVDAAIQREWVVSLGSRDALARIAHLICELAARLEMAGLTQNQSFHFPLTQQNLADACGLSAVHVNRILRELRRRGLISLEGRRLMLLKREELEQVAEFCPNYLSHGGSR